ncbi:MAG: ATP-binding cassette domain-containing protein, partial [Bacteroidetes bacterium]|nr:ATP-binding cassette domain-containing protein [Bacteroidota bacterium]
GQRKLYADLGQLEWLAQTAYLAQHPFLFEGTVKENLTLRIPSFQLDVDLVNNLVDRLELRSSLGDDPLQFVLQEGGSNLSGGQQQRLALLRALQVERPVLILDEATSALDERMRDVVFSLLRERADAGATVILVTHDMEIAAQCDERLNLAVWTIVGNEEQTS